MGLNPKRVWSDLGLQRLFTAMTTAASSGPLVAASARLVTAVGVADNGKPPEGVVAADQGFGTAVPLGVFPLMVAGAIGTIYTHSPPLVFTGVAVLTAQTIVGVVLEPTASAGDYIAYLEFDNSVTVTEAGQNVVLLIEVGYNANGLYLKPRVMPLGV